MRKFDKVRWLIVLVLSIGLVFMWVRQITGAPIVKDASQSLQMGINLAHYGTLALEPEPPLVPTNYREPLPPIVSSLIVVAIDAVYGRTVASDYFSGRRAQLLKLQNLAWLAFFSICVFLVTQRLTASFITALIAVVLVNVPFRPHLQAGPIDDLLNEIPSLGMLVAASGLLAIAYVRKRPAPFVLCGLVFGALALTKAINFYVFFAVFVVLAGLLVAQRRASPLRAGVRNLGMMLAAFLCVVGPWIARNRIELGTFQITLRSGEAMMERSLEDLMTPDEFKGAIYLWAPHFRDRIGGWLGFSPKDLVAGGRLQRLDDDPGSELSKADLVYERAGMPEKTVTFYRRARAERIRIEDQLERSGDPQPEVDADKQLKDEGVTEFVANPVKHVQSSLLFWWRGTVDTSIVLTAALLFALRERRYDLALFVMPSLGAAAAYVLATPFFSRYDVPMHFVSICTVVIVAKMIWDIARKRTAGDS